MIIKQLHTHLSLLLTDLSHCLGASLEVLHSCMHDKFSYVCKGINISMVILTVMSSSCERVLFISIVATKMQCTVDNLIRKTNFKILTMFTSM